MSSLHIKPDVGTCRRVGWATALAVLCLWPAVAQAGPWTRSGGRWYAKLSQQLYTAQGFRDASGVFNRGTEYLGLITAFYGEVGLGRRLQAQLYLPFVVGVNRFSGEPVSGSNALCDNGRRAQQTVRRSLGDAFAGAQWSSPWLPFPHALRLNAKLPLYDLDGEHACASLFPQPGDGQLDLELWLSGGDSFGQDGRFYAFAELGHQLRSELYFGTDRAQAFADSLLAAGQFGVRIGQGWFAMLGARLVMPYVADGVSKGFFTLNPGFALPLGRGFAAELTLELTPWSRNAASGTASRLFFTSAIVGVSHKLE